MRALHAEQFSSEIDVTHERVIFAYIWQKNKILSYHSKHME